MAGADDDNGVRHRGTDDGGNTMRAKIRRIFAVGRQLTTVAAITIAAAVLLRPSTANARPVEYLKICQLYSAAYFYLPGTDTCIDLATTDARVPTGESEVSDLPTCPSPSTFVSDATDSSCTPGNPPVGGGSTVCAVACVSGDWQITGKVSGNTWRWRLPNNPRKWVPTPQAGCQGGQLVKFGDITGSGLTQNSYDRYETTTHYPLKLKQGQFIASVLYQGAITVIPLNHLVSDLPACTPDNAGDIMSVTDATDSNCTAGGTPVGGGDGACIVECVDGAWQFNGNRSGLGGLGNFCMFYYYNDPTIGSVYTPLGCVATASQGGPPATSMFTPDMPIPPATENQVYVLGASADRSPPQLDTVDIQGTLSVWLCLQSGPRTSTWLPSRRP